MFKHDHGQDRVEEDDDKVEIIFKEPIVVEEDVKERDDGSEFGVGL